MQCKLRIPLLQHTISISWYTQYVPRLGPSQLGRFWPLPRPAPHCGERGDSPPREKNSFPVHPWSPSSSSWWPLSTWQTQQDGNQNISWGRNSLFSLNNRFGNCFLPQQVYHHSDAGRPISSETIFFSFSFKSWLLWWKCGLVFFAQPLKITNYILPSHCHCRP